MLINEDCLMTLKNLKSDSIDMVYFDPPFFSQKIQSLSDKDGKIYSYDDKWESINEYKRFIYDRLVLAKKALKDTGSIFFHCNNSASHHIRVLLDDVFGSKNFKSEIIWTYKRWSNSKNGLLNSHQNIFYYTKSFENFKFNKIYTDYSPTTNVDQNLQVRKRASNGKTIYKTDQNGEQIYKGEKKGVPLSDVWEIPYLNPKAKERTGYPTQKPVNLLERIIEISTNIGDLVLDPFCGSGSTLVAAKLMNRKYIGIDNNIDAIELSKKRLEIPKKSESNLLISGKDSYLTKSDFELTILNNFDCKIVQRNKGIDAVLKNYYFDGPVAIKLQKPEESLNAAIEMLKTAGDKKKCSFLILISTQINKETINKPLNMLIINSYEKELLTFIDNTNEMLRAQKFIK